MTCAQHRVRASAKASVDSLTAWTEFKHTQATAAQQKSQALGMCPAQHMMRHPASAKKHGRPGHSLNLESPLASAQYWDVTTALKSSKPPKPQGFKVVVSKSEENAQVACRKHFLHHSNLLGTCLQGSLLLAITAAYGWRWCGHRHDGACMPPTGL